MRAAEREMSLELDWHLLDDELSVRFLDTVNRALESLGSKRPSFLGEVHFTDLHFGTHPPDLTIRSIGDIWSDFVSLEQDPIRRRTGVSREATPASNSTTLVESPVESFAPVSELPMRTYTQFDDAAPPHRIHGPPSVMSTHIAPTSASVHAAHPYYQQWSAALASRGIKAAGLGTAPASPMDSVPQSPGYFAHWQQQQQPASSVAPPLSAGLFPPYSANNSRHTSFDASSMRGPGPHSSVSQVGYRQRDSLQPPAAMYGHRSSFRSTPAASYRSVSGPLSPSGPELDDGSQSQTSLPSLQMHLSLVWPTSTFRLTVTTSILINYPSPAFMSLPLTLSVTGLVMKAGVIVALEGEHRRAHVCLTEDEEDTTPLDSPQETRPGFVYPAAQADGMRGKKQSPGNNILPSLSFESEVGQGDKHVLKNVGKVEKFIGEVLRKGLEDELVFPNYYTIDLPATKS